MKSSEPKNINDAIHQTLLGLGLAEKLSQYEVVNSWTEIVGDSIARVTKTESIRDGALIVRVIHPAWRQELVFLKKELIEKINRTMKKEIVKDIIFK
jgi:predicted nucleic acid-binding Zn ribbon protein